VYKMGAHFSRRSLDEVLTDIERAKALDDLMRARGIGIPEYTGDDYEKLSSIADEIKKSGKAAGEIVTDIAEGSDMEETDPRLAWFSSWFKQQPSLLDNLTHLLTWHLAGGKTCFLGDADGLILKPEFTTAVISAVKSNFPSIQRFTVYGRTKTAAGVRSLDDLRMLAEAGLNRVHFGIESGSDAVLNLINKGETSAEHIEGCLKIKEAGLSCSIYVMPGLGGVKYSEEHARETARVINEVAPDFVRPRTLEIFPRTPLEQALKDGEFEECSEEHVVRELRILINEINAETEILSDSASNLLDLNGRLPQDKDRLLKTIDNYLALSARNKLVFSFKSRLMSFQGQYGDLTEDIWKILAPYMTDNGIQVSACSNSTLQNLIRIIRSKLMP
ncbi:MAG: radical SAM protein, partial [Smithella sp.]